MSGLPEFLVRKVERAIADATNPKGMGLHDGMARIEASLLARLLQHAQLAAPEQSNSHQIAVKQLAPCKCVTVCPTLDRECGEYYGGWCATCPKARNRAQGERQPITEVWMVASRTISAVFTTEERAQQFANGLPPTVSGGLSVYRCPVHA